MRKLARHLTIVSLTVSLSVVCSAADSSAQTAQACLSGQLRAAGNACKAMTRCHATAMKKNGTVDPACIPARAAGLSAAFAELEALDTCLTEGGADNVASGIHARVLDLAYVLTPTGGKCASKKMGALGKECAGYLRCYAAAAANSGSVDAGCLFIHEGRLAKSFTKIEAKGDCVTTGDMGGLQPLVGFVAEETYTYLRGTGTTTTTTTTSTSTVTMP